MMEIPASDTPLPRKVFNHHIDRFIETGQLNPDILPFMDTGQQYVINEVKKSLNRLKNKYAR